MASRPARPWAVLWRWRANPLRRRCDVIEAWVLLAVALLLVAGAPLAAVLVFLGVQQEGRDQRAEREQVPAVLLADANEAVQGEGHEEARYTAEGDELARVQARWQAPDGSWHRGTLLVEPEKRAGTPVQLWVDRGGDRTAAPPGPLLTGFQAVLCSGLACGALAVVAHGIRRAVTAVLDRRRAAMWERAWAEVEPRWRPRTP